MKYARFLYHPLTGFILYVIYACSAAVALVYLDNAPTFVKVLLIAQEVFCAIGAMFFLLTNLNRRVKP